MHRKGRLAVLLALLMILSSGAVYGETTPELPPAFSDIGGHWAEKIIEEAAEMKLVGGYPDGTFRPDNLIKREEFFKLLTNILTVTPDTSGTTVRFSDVDSAEWYAPVIKTAVAANITQGYGDGTFGIGMMISRQEAAKVTGSVIPSNVSDSASGVGTALDRKSIADWAYPYADLMFKKGYMKGDTEGYFRPTMALTRAEAATILLNVKKNEPMIAANADNAADSSCLQAHGGEAGAFTSGDGTRAEPYEISTEAQLNHVRMHLTEGAFYVLKKNIAITSDYTADAVTDPKVTDWSQGNFAPIGSKELPFSGSLDGNGYTVSGLNIMGTEGRGDEKRAADYAGLFGYMAEDSVVSDLTIDASRIEGDQYVGSVAGYTAGSIKDCTVGTKGIVRGSSNVGGLAGFSSASLSNLQNLGTVSGAEQVGGIVGYFTASSDSTSVIKGCNNKGTVTSDSYQAGGITGYAGGLYYSASITNCSNTGEVTGSGSSGGIAGILDRGKSEITHCSNAGTVEGSNAGGIVGYNKGSVSGCYNSQTVMATLAAGGIAAYQTDGEGEITKCYNEGSVIADSYSGGIAGENGAAISYCYNSGKVRGTGVSGGIAGKNIAAVKYVYCAGVVTGESASGSLLGRNAGTLAYAFWLNTSNALPVGMSDGSATQTTVERVTHEELSGQQKIKMQDGYEMLIKLLNQKQENWKYLYTITKEAPANNTTISNGGNVVPPLELPSTDSTGNTIDASDLTSKYLYPVLIQE